MDTKSQWIDYLPRALREEGVLRSGDDLEEIRLRVGRPMELLSDKGRYYHTWRSSHWGGWTYE